MFWGALALYCATCDNTKSSYRFAPWAGLIVDNYDGTRRTVKPCGCWYVTRHMRVSMPGAVTPLITGVFNRVGAAVVASAVS
jgi:hypothetical protein